MFKKLITQLLNKFSWSDFLAARDEIEIKKDVDLEPVDFTAGYFNPDHGWDEPIDLTSNKFQGVDHDHKV